MATRPSWGPVSLEARIQRHPTQITPAPVMGALDLLPFDQMLWEDFEKIQWRIMRDVEGLRYAQIYGERGQAQQGLDVVALTPGRSGVALQSKRYSRFGPAELEAAVKKFRTTNRPFDVERLIIGVSREVKSTKALTTLSELRGELQPMQLDLWDKQALSDLLRNAPEIVIEFFGMPTAQRFCLPFELQPVVVPTADAVAIREALARTPEEVTGAAKLLHEAREASDDPARSLQLIEEAQEKLRNGRFHSYAAQHEPDRALLLARLGRSAEAARRALDEFWSALDQGLTSTAQMTQRRLQKIAGNDHASLSEYADVAEVAMELYFNPLASLPEATRLQIGNQTDQLRLAVLAGETALANDNLGWLRSAASTLAALSDAGTGDEALRTRLRLLFAEAGGDWTDVLSEARKLKLGHELLSLVTSRYARSCALEQRFEEADALWDEAVGDACLAQRWTDASIWVFSRRGFRARWKPFSSDELLPLERALREMGPASRIVTTDDSAYQQAIEDLSNGRLRSAAISAQRALRDAVVTSDWVAEEKARRVLASVLVESDEPEVAAHHLARAAAIERIEELASTFPNRFIDVVAELDAPNYWTVAAAYRSIAKQADVVPDQALVDVASHILAEFEGAERGALVDLRPTATSRYLGAVRALAGIANRIEVDLANDALAHFERQPEVDEHRYRLHDEHEATAVARIALIHPSLRERAITHLVTLLARSQSARNSTTIGAIDDHIAIARDHLTRLSSAGNRWARETLAAHDVQGTSAEVAAAALERLVTPLTHQPHRYTSGTNAVGDALLASALESDQLQPAVAELLQRANDPHVGDQDRGDYLLAAARLTPKIGLNDRNRHFREAMRYASSPTRSEHDALDEAFGHALGAFRITSTGRNSRNKALYLAACLATNSEQRAEVRNQTFALLGEGEASDYWSARTLQKLGDTMRDDVGFLSAQSWALRSLAATFWTKHGHPPHVGLRLASDDDVRVRRALADALAQSPSDDCQTTVREMLASDPAYSVRAALHGDHCL